MYRDELTKASQRIEELQARLDAQNEELFALRAAVSKRLGPGAGSPRRRTRVILAILAGVGLVGAVVWARISRAPARTPLPAATSAAPSGRPLGLTQLRSSSSDPGFRLGVADAARVDALASRCERHVPRESMDALPRGTRVLDFLTCAGCDCCLPGGEFPPTFDDRAKPIAASAVCHQCSRDWTLEAAGLTVSGGHRDDPLWGSSGLIFRLQKPSRVFALRVAGASYRVSDAPLPDQAVSIIAYDENGRPIDGARATYPSSRSKDERLDFTALERVLLVEACDGEAIGRVDLATSDSNMHVKAIAFLP